MLDGVAETAAAGLELTEIVLPDGQLAYRRSGAGPPTLFLHGTHLAGLWLPFHDLLAGGADVVYPVHPGFREGEPPPWLQGLDDLVLCYRDLLDELALERVHVVGHALGGWVAAELAVFCPERVASLVLAAPLGLRVPGRPPADFLAASPERLQDLLGGAEFLPDFDDPEEFSRFYGELGVTARLIWERRYDLKLERRLPRVSQRALVLHGDEDRLLPREHAERWAELLPNARLESVEGAGHLLPAQAPEACAEAVLDFLGAGAG